ncbi:trans-4-hydroxycyclohexanecarboxylate dehydrogenase [Sinomonas cyclohexanicum]|uniref:Trans-4-hydroxycyclohexanecarboxylate dehydrogenase n=1 Tax=Sinomonas cyclohexanicum TaxID=322009 RepID=CHCB1_SINCY|nr:SDR family oxidoreductase [Corynebacterium cyclohexanicum]BCT75148.1 trans-4-hydroxycyclohexanecarboxylate dehydrogenase [Corynebacterium cyclohexanicum]
MSRVSDRVAEKVALISGAARGMGASHAQVLAAHGANVVIADLLEDEGRALAEKINAEFNTGIGRDVALFVHLDVTDYESWTAAVGAAVERFGTLDVLVNNAGIFTRGSVEDADVDEWRRTIEIDLTGNFLGMKAAVPAMKAAGGSIINISSIAGLVGFKNRAAYAAAKWGVQGLTKTSAMDLGPYNIRVNSVHPGSVKTPMTAGLKRGFGQIPLGRDAETQEISDLILFLASDESSFMTGANLAIDGGETAGNNLRQDA